MDKAQSGGDVLRHIYQHITEFDVQTGVEEF